jgi:hypothetical protein
VDSPPKEEDNVSEDSIGLVTISPSVVILGASFEEVPLMVPIA